MLLPQELKNHTFSHAIRGYTAAEVDEYIEFVVGKYEELYRENGELAHKLAIAMQSLDTLRAREAKIAALDAEVKKVAARILADSEKKQQEILADAETRRRQIIDDAGEYADRIVAEADAHVLSQEKRFAALQKQVETLRDTLFAAYSGHIDQVEALVSAVLAEKFTDPIPSAADLSEIAEEIPAPVAPAAPAAPAAPVETAEVETADKVDEIEEIEELEDIEEAEDVYTEEELQEEDEPAPAEAPRSNAAIFLPDDFRYDEDVYTEEELYGEDEPAAEPETFTEPEIYEDPEVFEKPEVFAEPETYEEAAAMADVEYFEEVTPLEEGETFAEIAAEDVLAEMFSEEEDFSGEELFYEEEPVAEAEDDPLAEDDAQLLRELHDAFDQSFAALKSNTAAEEEPVEDDAEEEPEEDDSYDDADGDEWLAALKKLENVVKAPGKAAREEKEENDEFTFLDESAGTADTRRRGLFGRKKPKDR